jgi:hypothetical protein
MKQHKSESMHSFHHSSSPMHLPAAADALVVLADNDAGDALVAASVIDVAGCAHRDAGGRGGTTRESRSRHTDTSTRDWLDEGVR